MNQGGIHPFTSHVLTCSLAYTTPSGGKATIARALVQIFHGLLPTAKDGSTTTAAFVLVFPTPTKRESATKNTPLYEYGKFFDRFSLARTTTDVPSPTLISQLKQ